MIAFMITKGVGMSTKEIIQQLERLISEAEENFLYAERSGNQNIETVFVMDKVALEYAITIIKKYESIKSNINNTPINLTTILDDIQILVDNNMPSAWTVEETKAIQLFLNELKERRME